MRISNNRTRWIVLLLLGLVSFQDYAQATEGTNIKVQRQHLVTDMALYHAEQAKQQQDSLRDFEKASDVDDVMHLQQASKGMSQGNSTAASGPPKPSEKQNEPSNKQQIELSLEVDGPSDLKVGEGNSTKSIEKSDKDHIQIVSDLDSESNSGMEEKGELSAEGKLEEQIEQQAKEFEAQQLKNLQAAKAAGKLKISSAAAALNAYMMGTQVDSAESAKAVVHISTDQMYVDEEDADSKENSYKDPNNESATLDRAKEAAKEYVNKHPESQVFKKEPEKLRESQSKSKNATQKLTEVAKKLTKDKQLKKTDTKVEAKTSPSKNATKVEAQPQKKEHSEKPVAQKSPNATKKSEPTGSKPGNNQQMQTSQLDDADSVLDSTKQDLITAIDQAEVADDDDSNNKDETEKLEKASKKIEKNDKMDDDASALAEEDLNVPKWPKYSDPTSQQEEIKTELVEVKKESKKWKELADKSQKDLKDKSKFSSLTQFKKKQHEIDLQHSLTVQNIKSEIYSDREQFLQKLLVLEKDEEEEEQKQHLTQSRDEEKKEEKKDEKKDEKKEEKKEEKKLDKNHADSFDDHGKGWESEKEGGKDWEKSVEGMSDHDMDVDSFGDLHRLDRRQRSHSRNYGRDSDRKCPGGKCEYAEDRIREDRYGKYVEDDASNYQKSRREIQRALDSGRDSRRSYSDFESDRRGAYDYESSRRYRSRNSRFGGDYDDYHRSSEHLTEEEWLLKQKKEKKNLDELTQKEKELEAASKEVNQAQDLLAQEKQKIDAEINQKMKEMENMKREFEEKEAQRIESERLAAEERQRIENIERQKEKEKRQSQLRETENIERRAYDLHLKEQELKKQRIQVQEALHEVDDEIRKVQGSVDYSSSTRYKVDNRRKELRLRDQYRESMENHRKEQYERESSRREQARKEKLMNSCPQSKVRTYACNEDGIRIVKYFNYEYDFRQGQCVESVKENQERCDNSRESSYKSKDRYAGEEDELYDDKRRGSSRSYRGGKRYRGRNAQTSSNDQTDTDSQEQDQSKKQDQEIESPPTANKHQMPVPKSHHIQKHASKNMNKPEQEQDSQKQDKEQQMPLTMKANEEAGQPESNEEPEKEVEAPLPKKHQKKAKGSHVQQEKTLDPHSADAIGNAGDDVGDGASEVDIDKEKSKSPDHEQQQTTQTEQETETSNEDEEDPDQIEQKTKQIEKASSKQIKTLKKHIGNIEGKVSQLTKAKSTQSHAAQTPSKSKDHADQDKIEKFAKMLKTLNGYKTQYKNAKSEDEKQDIHDTIADFTQKWLDAKNLQLSDEVNTTQEKASQKQSKK